MKMDRAPGTPFSSRNGHATDPSRRALEAMASAARRAQASEERPVVDEGNAETGRRRLVARSTTASRRAVGGPVPRPLSPPRQPGSGAGGLRPGGATTTRSDWRTRWGLDDRRARTLLLVGVVGILVIAGAGLGLGLALRSAARTATSPAGAARRSSVTHRGTGPSTAPSGGKPSGGKKSQPSAKPGTSGHGGTAGSASTATSAPPTTAPPATPGGPRLSSVSPAAGGAGQTVVVSGSGLFSSNGEVLAYFGGQAAPTSCASQTSCTVTVPDLGAGRSTVPLTVVTDNGRSNALTFSYA